jgi:hypothetical protein
MRLVSETLVIMVFVTMNQKRKVIYKMLIMLYFWNTII